MTCHLDMEQNSSSVPVVEDNVSLSVGNTHYIMWGDAGAPLAVLIHGFSQFSYAWEEFGPSLAQQCGLRVLAYDLYGRGRSSTTVFHENTRDLFISQFLELLDALQLHGPIALLVGFSMGGAISVCLAERLPERIQRLCLLGPAGISIAKSMTSHILTLPWIGRILFKTFAPNEVVKAQKTDFYSVTDPRVMALISKTEEMARWQLENTPDYTTHLHSSLKSFAAVGKNSGPPHILIMWGDKDGTCPYANAEVAARLIPRARLVTVENSGHCVLGENPEFVTETVMNFYRETSRRSEGE